MFDTLPASLGLAVSAAGTVMGTFWKYEEVASPDAKLTATHWLKYSGPTTIHAGWADHLVVAFNKIFGERHFSFKCFFRSCLASLIAICIMLLVWTVLRPDEFLAFFRHYTSRLGGTIFLMSLIAVMFVINCVPDYFSYMKTRLILKEITKSEKFSRVFLFAVIDTVLTLLIFVFVLVLADLLFLGRDALRTIFETLHRWLPQGLALHAPGAQLPIGVFLYAALFVSAWSWLYALSALTTRLMFRLFPKLLTKTAWFFDVDGHPLRSLGCMAGGIVFIAVLALKNLA